jgi:hypothetical protein
LRRSRCACGSRATFGRSWRPAPEGAARRSGRHAARLLGRRRRVLGGGVRGGAERRSRGARGGAGPGASVVLE